MDGFSVVIHPNGFVTVWDNDGGRWAVQGMVSHVKLMHDRRRRGIFKADPTDSRPSCSCKDGFNVLWCDHKEAAAAKIREELR